jgi:hypothetical protein
MADKLFKDYYNEKTESVSVPVNGKLLVQTGTNEPEKIDVDLLKNKVGQVSTTTNINLNDAIYESYGDATALTSNIVIDDTNSLIGFTARLIHNSSTEPTITTTQIIIKKGSYLLNGRNDIYISKTGSNEITVIYLNGTTVIDPNALTAFNLTGFTQNNIEFTSTLSGLYQNFGNTIADVVADGYIQMVYLTTDNTAIFAALDTLTTSYNNVKYHIQVSGSGGLFRGNQSGGSSISLGLNVAVNDVLRCERIGSEILLKRSQDGGISFTTLHTYTGVSTANFKAMIFGNGIGKKISSVDVVL